ncbi:MAG: aerotolerance regulator BatA [Flavobacteriales bacterium]|nr:aerotolerance regulator BatA [Flavobacteriales bacterium]|tara:strand:- start:150 stop:1163 length:1014 start_codon:yes stop_codon:yes gene_type:complete
MIELINKISWENKSAFLLFLLLLAIIVWKFFFKQKNSSLIFPNSNLLSKKKSLKQRLIMLPLILKILSLIFVILALARPQIINTEIKKTTEGIDIILAIDISGSMQEEDLKPNRLEASKKIAIEFVKKRKNDRIGVVVFSGRAGSTCPLTTDHNSVINLINNLSYEMLPDGTHIGDGIGVSINRLMNSTNKSKIIILLTDGNDDGEGKFSPIKSAQLAATDTVNIKIYTIGVGEDRRVQGWMRGADGFPVYVDQMIVMDSVTLKEIANITNGEYFRATNNRKLQQIYEKIDQLETTEMEIIEEFSIEEKFHTFIQLSLITLTLAIILNIFYFKKLLS